MLFYVIAVVCSWCVVGTKRLIGDTTRLSVLETLLKALNVLNPGVDARVQELPLRLAELTLQG